MKRLLYVLILLLTPLLWGQGYTNAGGGSVPAGSGTGSLSVGGVLCKGVGIATTGTSEEVLATCTIPASTLSANGSYVGISLVAHTAANANNKQLRIRVGGLAGTLVYDSTATAANNINYVSVGPIVVRRISATAATAQGLIITVVDGTGTTPGTYRSSTLRTVAITWANSLDLVVTGTTPTAAADLTLDSYTVEVAQ